MPCNLTCWGGVGNVTGANFLLQIKNKKILVDCGLLQGVEGSATENAKPFPYDVSTIDYLFITHAHMDHIGRVPKIVRDGFKGIIYSTLQTRELAEIMFADAVKVMESNIREGKMTGTPLYNAADVSAALALWQIFPYDTDNKLDDDISVRLLDAGHILGSSMYEFSCEGKHIVFTGDSGNSPSPLLRDTEKIVGAQYLIMDSVYGDRNHEPKSERDARFEQIVRETIALGGALVIPTFSIERTQVILYELNNMFEKSPSAGGLPSVPVYLDSPLALKVTEVYKRSTDLFNDHVRDEIQHGDDIFSFPKLQIIHSGYESRKVEDIPNPKIILAGSGMSEGGRVVGHEIAYIGDPKSTILLMGYQALGTLGRRIEDLISPGRGPSTIEINGEILQVRARIEMIEGYSGHKDMDGLLAMAEDTAETVKKIFVVMGEPKSSLFLVQRLRDYLGVDAMYPERGKVYELK